MITNQPPYGTVFHKTRLPSEEKKFSMIPDLQYYPLTIKFVLTEYKKLRKYELRRQNYKLTKL